MRRVVAECTALSILNKDILSMMPKLEEKAKLALEFPPAYIETVLVRHIDGRPVYRYMRGTNMVENLNRQIQQADTYRCTPEITHGVLLMVCAFRSRLLNVIVLGRARFDSDDFI
jgi:hypothetical protein